MIKRVAPSTLRDLSRASARAFTTMGASFASQSNGQYPLQQQSSIAGTFSHIRGASAKRLYCTSSTSQHSSSVARGSFFDFLGIEPAVVIPEKQMHKSYHQIQRKAHPDMQQGSTEEEKHRNEEDSVFANQAYETLKDPFLRCRYLLKLRDAQEDKGESNPLTLEEKEAISVAPPPDGTSASSDNDGVGTKKSKNVPEDMEYLMEMFELNEAFEAIVEAFSPEEDGEGESPKSGGEEDQLTPEQEKERTEELTKLLEVLNEKNDAFYDSIVSSWEKNDIDTFRSKVMKWSMVYKLRQRVKEAL